MALTQTALLYKEQIKTSKYHPYSYCGDEDCKICGRPTMNNILDEIDNNPNWDFFNGEQPVTTQNNVESTLQERGNRYGEFSTHSLITQDLKNITNHHLKTLKKEPLSAPHQEAIDMIFHKIGRIINGDPNYADSWHDIAGYATLAEKECISEGTTDNTLKG